MFWNIGENTKAIDFVSSLISVRFRICSKLTQTLVGVVTNAQERFRRHTLLRISLAMFWNISETHQGYSVVVLITFDEISDSLKNDSNISYGSEECSIDVSETYFASDYLSHVLKYLWKINENSKAIALVS